MPTAASAPPRRVVLATHRKLYAARHAFRNGLGYLLSWYARMGRFSQSTRWSCRRAARMAQSSNCRSDCLLHVPHASAVSAHTCYVRLSSRRPSREQSPSAAAVAADAASRCSAAVAADGCEPSDRLAPVGLPTRPQVDYPNLSKMCTDLEAAIKVRASPRACGTHSQQLSRRLLSSERHAVCMCNHHRCGRCKHTRLPICVHGCRKLTIAKVAGSSATSSEEGACFLPRPTALVFALAWNSSTATATRRFQVQP